MTTYTSPFSGNTIQPTDVSYASYTGLTSNLVLQWPVNGNTGNPAARVMEISFTGSGGLVYMPDATQVSVGQDALIRNVGSCLLYTSPSPRDGLLSRMPSSA